MVSRRCALIRFHILFVVQILGAQIVIDTFVTSGEGNL